MQVPGKDAAAPPARLLLLVQDSGGYLNLCQLLSRAWTHNVQRDQAVIAFDALREHSQGLIALSGAQAGAVGQALLQGDETRAADLALQLAAVFPHRFFLELQRVGRADDEPHVMAAVQLAARLRLPVVATQRCSFWRPTISRRMRRGCALPKAKFWAMRAAPAVSRPSSTSGRVRRWPSGLPICPRPWPTRWKLPSAAT
jgi:DNA polymerase III alpha subunit